MCYWARVAQQRIADAGIPDKYQACTFDNYRAYNDGLIDALALARGRAARPLLPIRDEAHQGLLLIGPAGVGKTHLAVAVLMEIMRSQGVWGIFYKTRDLLRLLRNSYVPSIQTSELQILRPIFNCDLLVLDDLGAERTTNWVDEVMNSIVDTRYSSCRPIIATSNFPDLDDPDEVNGLLHRIGFRMQSRLREMCRIVTLDGADYRDMPAAATDADFRREGKARRKHLPGRPRGGRPAPTPHDGKGDLKWPGGKGGNT